MMNHSRPLTREQQQFAADHHGVILIVLRAEHIDDDLYDVAIFGYLRAVRQYTTFPHLHRYSFYTIARNAIRSEVDCDRKKLRRRPHGQSLDAEVGENGRKLYEFVPAPDPELLVDSSEDLTIARQYVGLLDALSARQREVLELKAAGYTDRETGELLGITAKAVGNLAYKGRRAAREAELQRSRELKEKVDQRIGRVTDMDAFRIAEDRARRKLAIYQTRNPDVDYYDEDYLVELAADCYNEQAFTTYCYTVNEARRLAACCE